MTHTIPRLNRVDPHGDLHRVPERGIFTGNRGCLVDDDGEVVRHHLGDLWITCVLFYKDWRAPLDQPRHWTPLFFLDDAVALAAGHRPCGLCRRHDYLSYREAVREALALTDPPSATDLNRMLAGERLIRGRGVSRGAHRKVWTAPAGSIPDGTVVLDSRGRPRLMLGGDSLEFTFGGWVNPTRADEEGDLSVLTPPTSFAALANGFEPSLHPSAALRAPRG